jgi:hypothetical protein
MPDNLVDRRDLESGLSGASVVGIDRDETGSLRRVLVERAVDDDEFTPSRTPTVFETEATIDPEGIVRESRSISVREPEDGAARERRIEQTRFHGIGETEVGVPTWVWHL